MKRLGLRLCLLVVSLTPAGCAAASQADGASLTAELARFALELLRQALAALAL